MDTLSDIRPLNNYIINGFFFFQKHDASRLNFILKLRGFKTNGTSRDVRSSNKKIHMYNMIYFEERTSDDVSICLTTA